MIEDRSLQPFELNADYVFRPYVPIPEGSAGIVDQSFSAYISKIGEIPLQLARHLTKPTNSQLDPQHTDIQAKLRIDEIRKELGLTIENDTAQLNSHPDEIQQQVKTEQSIKTQGIPVLVYDMTRRKPRRQMMTQSPQITIED